MESIVEERLWNCLPQTEKEEYKRLILALVSLSEAFSNKRTDDAVVTPVLNYKYHETVFARVFGATQEDINNTSYDASLQISTASNQKKRYLIGLKTFGYSSGAQKIAQFKSYMPKFSGDIEKMIENAAPGNGGVKTKTEIDTLNAPLYKNLAERIAAVRNERMVSAQANLQGFSDFHDAGTVEYRTVYHVVMPDVQGDKPLLHVGEIPYDTIDIDNIEILGCTSAKNPANFSFTDGRHKYRFTAADSQLLMDFDTKNSVCETWDVKYVDAFDFLHGAIERAYEDSPVDIAQSRVDITQSVSFKITVEKFSGFNAFNGVGSKLSKGARQTRINNFVRKYEGSVPSSELLWIQQQCERFLLGSDTKEEKVRLREKTLEKVDGAYGDDFSRELRKIFYSRPLTEMYIPIPQSKKFHRHYPDFFRQGLGGALEEAGWKTGKIPRELQEFTLVFEPSGEKMVAHIVQDGGKGIQSAQKQTYLGEWILRGVFQLREYEPLTDDKLNELGINGLRFYKTAQSDEVHMQFIWIDDDNHPEDYFC